MSAPPARSPRSGKVRAAVLLATLGVVYGDIGTSPLYAVKECFSPESPHRVPVTTENVLGVLSLMFWALILVVSTKYLMFVMRADNDGSGGILALFALISKRAGRAITMCALLGTALLCGEAVITPAISVLSAVEGLHVATTALDPVVIPLTCAILFGLFSVQSRGTGKVGKLFGPVTLVWFTMIAALGARAIARVPAVLRAFDPRWGVSLFSRHGLHALLLLGGVVLVITGVEALYADMGHFDKKHIRVSWFGLVLPALLTNYFGQGALLLEDPSAASNPFYALVPSGYLYLVVAIATVATVVASQALISGIFSLLQQAIQLGYFPRMTIVHTSSEARGQIYMPEVNWLLLTGCVALVIGFGSSTALAAAYGFAVTGTMVLTSILFFVVTRAWRWPRYASVPLVGLFLVVDLAFLFANAAKIPSGGWFPVVLAGAILVVMTTWSLGRREAALQIGRGVLPLDLLLEDIERSRPHRVKGTAVFMASDPERVPPALLHHFKHNQVLHEQVVLFNVATATSPVVSEHHRVSVSDRGHGFFQVHCVVGFMESPNVPDALSRCHEKGLEAKAESTSYYLGREAFVTTGDGPMPRWRKGFFALLSRNAQPATQYFGLPPNRVVELGQQVTI